MKIDLQFGEKVEGYNIPVLNEREIRAAAGIMFLLLFMSLMMVLFHQDFVLVKYVVIIFFTDFIIRVLLNPRYSPTLIIGRMIVSRQVPEYVGAPQKKFAWTIGMALSGLMFILLVILNSYSIITSVSCFVCLGFLFFESSFGICLGCIFYGWFFKEKALHCAGEVCTVPEKHNIQKTSGMQFMIVAGFLVGVILAIVFLNSYFNVAPKNLRELLSS